MVPDADLFLHPSVFMQRIGFLRSMLRIARSRRRGTQELLSSDLARAITTTLPIEHLPHDNVVPWLEKRQQEKKYGASPRSLKRVQWQDAYLSDPAMPSFTGSLTPDTTIDIPRWAAHLGLLRRDTWGLSSAGEALLRLDELSGSWKPGTYAPEDNPFILNSQTNVGRLLGWSLLCIGSDLVALQALLPLLPTDEPFDRTVAGDTLGQCLEALAQPAKDPRRVAADASLRKLVDALRKQKGTSARGIREHVIAVRLEPLVDIGALQKLDKFRWIYVQPTSTRTAAERKPPASETWPDVGWVNSFLQLNLQPEEDEDKIWNALYEGFRIVQSPMRFAGLAETIFAGLWILANQGFYFEWEAARSLMSVAQKRAPRDVRFNVDRYGAVRHIRLVETLPKA